MMYVHCSKYDGTGCVVIKRAVFCQELFLDDTYCSSLVNTGSIFELSYLTHKHLVIKSDIISVFVVEILASLVHLWLFSTG